MTGERKNLITIGFNLWSLRKNVKITPEVQKLVDLILEGVTEKRLLNFTSKYRGIPTGPQGELK